MIYKKYFYSWGRRQRNWLSW